MSALAPGKIRHLLLVPVLLLFASTAFAQIIVDGNIDPQYGIPLAGDSEGDGNGEAAMDLLRLLAHEDDDNFYFAFQINAHTSAEDWGHYVLYIDVTSDSQGATHDALGYNVEVRDPHKPEFAIYTRLDNPPYGPEDTRLLAWNGTNWDFAGETQVAEAALGCRPRSLIEWRIPKAVLGDPFATFVEVWSTGGVAGQNAQDTLNDPTEDWNADDWTTTALLSNSTIFPPPSDACPDRYRWSTTHDPRWEWDPYPDTFRGWLDVRVVNDTRHRYVNLKARITCAPDNVTIIDGEVGFGTIGPGERKWSFDDFAVEIDMTNPLDPWLGILWEFEWEDVCGNKYRRDGIPKFCGEIPYLICPENSAWDEYMNWGDDASTIPCPGNGRNMDEGEGDAGGDAAPGL